MIEKIYAEIVNGKCPTCSEFTMLVGLTNEYYRCMNCGADLQQHNSYQPPLVSVHVLLGEQRLHTYPHFIAKVFGCRTEASARHYLDAGPFQFFVAPGRSHPGLFLAHDVHRIQDQWATNSLYNRKSYHYHRSLHER